MIGFPIGLIYANAVEWVVHKYVLHGLGKRKNSFFGFHWKNHHRNARRFAMLDPEYEKPIWNWESRGREVAPIALMALIHTPFIAVAPWFTAAVWYSSFNYLHKHKKCHVDVEWGKRHMRSHYDHHMGKDQDTNWCVTRPWFDWVMGTRVHFDEQSAEAEPRVRVALDGAAGPSSALPVMPIAEMPAELNESSGVPDRSDVFNSLEPVGWSSEAGNEPTAAPSTPPKAA
jgi:Fatty acid hydroxylase superfamily